MAWSSNTLKTRNSQWAKFINYCGSVGLCPLPAECTTLCRFLIVQARTSKYSTINNYVSAINVLHKFYGYTVDFCQFFLTKLVLSGLKARLGGGVTQKHPLTIENLSAISELLPMSEQNQSLWCAVVFALRTLLRKSNIVPDGSVDTHVVRRQDIFFYSDKIVVHVLSSKTNRYRDCVFEIPISPVSNKKFCLCTMLNEHFLLFPAPPSSPLFRKRVHGGSIPVTYLDLLSFVKWMVTLIGLDPNNVGLHSLRRSGAAYLYRIGVPLQDIQTIGDWSSLAVLMYLSTPFSRKCEIELAVANSFAVI